MTKISENGSLGHVSIKQERSALLLISLCFSTRFVNYLVQLGRFLVSAQVLLNSMLKEERVSLDAARDLLINGHSSASEEENRPKPCVPLAEQVRLQAAAAHSTEPADSMPQMAVAERCDMIAGSSTRRKAFRMEWGFSQHTKYPVMRLKQSSMLL